MTPFSLGPLFGNLDRHCPKGRLCLFGHGVGTVGLIEKDSIDFLVFRINDHNSLLKVRFLVMPGQDVDIIGFSV